MIELLPIALIPIILVLIQQRLHSKNMLKLRKSVQRDIFEAFNK